jgi:1-acyl-sn-glycerol-3-phosphate acyltransferase
VAPSIDLLAQAALETLRISVPTIFQAATGRLTSAICDQRLDSWSRALVKQAGITIDVHGRERIVPGEAYVVMSNHQSHYDIPVLFQALKLPLRMVAKKEIFQIPFMSGAMRAAGFIEVDRSNRKTAMQNLSSARTSLDAAVSIWIAPEGTRSKTGRLGSFKKGGFHLAMASGLRILPVSIDGTRFVLPTGGVHVTRGVTAQVTVGDPVDTSSYSRDRIRDLVADVRTAIEKYLPEALRA